MSEQRSVLLVEDDPATRSVYDEILHGAGYEVLVAGSRAEARRVLDQRGAAVDVQMVDISLPDADGVDVVIDSAARFGPRPTLYVSGWADEFWHLSETPGKWMVLAKPVPVPRLLAALRWLVEGGEKPPELSA